jgi:hypothetical protein
MNSSDLSKWEFCARLPELERLKTPDRFPIREAAKRHFFRGVAQVLSTKESTAVYDFLGDAASSGFIYPAGEAYYMAQDYACWIEGALSLVAEWNLEVRALPGIKVESNIVRVDNAYVDSDDMIQIFRVSDAEVGEEKWDSSIALLHEPKEIRIHSFHLPSLRKGRLSSPLVTGYRHPSKSFQIVRLAPLEGESFNAKWTRCTRWEERFSWVNWREGIDKDQCMDRIYLSESLPATSKLDEIRKDAAEILAVIRNPSPRKREVCPRCLYHRYCHGDEHERSLFT